jgi:protein CpxP
MTKRILVAAGLVAALAGGTAALAVEQGPRGGQGMQGPRGMARGGPGADLGLRGIELTDAQRAQVRAIRESHGTELTETARKLREARQAFAHAARGATVDEATIRSRSTELATAMADQALVHAKVRSEVHALLTAEQQQQLKDREARMEQRMQERQKQMQERRQRRQGTRPPQ